MKKQILIVDDELSILKLLNFVLSKDYNLISGGTDNHLMLIDLRNKNLTGKKAQETLDRAEITLNKNSVPFDDKSPFVTSGIRVGVPAITTRGMKEDHMQTVVDMVDKVERHIHYQLY